MHGTAYDYINVTFFTATRRPPKEMEPGGVREDRTPETPG